MEIIEPQSKERMFANPTTGEILLTPPEGVTVYVVCLSVCVYVWERGRGGM